MDFKALKAQIESGRRLEVQADGATFTLVVPNEHAWRRAFETNRDAMGRLLETSAMRSLLAEALIGWNGLTAQHFVLEAAEEPVEYSVPAKAELLDVRQDIADVLSEALALRRKEQREKREAARKN